MRPVALWAVGLDTPTRGSVWGSRRRVEKVHHVKRILTTGKKSRYARKAEGEAFDDLSSLE